MHWFLIMPEKDFFRSWEHWRVLEVESAIETCHDSLILFLFQVLLVTAIAYSLNSIFMF